jgi:hypothetical protein
MASPNSDALRLHPEMGRSLWARRSRQGTAIADEPVILPAYVDEAGARGLVRELKPERDQAISLMCALVFEPGGHAKAIETFRPGFEAFCHAMPLGAKLHITEAFKPGNEAWGKVSAEVRKEYVAHVKTVRPMIMYSARRLRLARDGHARDQMLIAAAQAALEYQDRGREPPQRCTRRGRSCDVPIAPARCVCG